MIHKGRASQIHCMYTQSAQDRLAAIRLGLVHMHVTHTLRPDRDRLLWKGGVRTRRPVMQNCGCGGLADPHARGFVEIARSQGCTETETADAT